MIIKDFNKKEYLKILKEIRGGYIYNYNGKLIKFDKIYAGEMLTRKRITSQFGTIKKDQIEWLSRLNGKVNSSLPEGIIYYEGIPVGIIYPHYFEGYKNLLGVVDEDLSTFYDIITKATDNNLELIKNGVCNTDLAFKNVLYKDSDVQLIDLDGNHIKRSSDSNYTEAYYYFVKDLFLVIKNRLLKTYSKEETKEILSDLVQYFPNPNEFKYDTPYEMLDAVKRSKILK